MAPLKFEEHIKEKLEQRKLQPSADAWQRLNEHLDDDSAKKNNKAFFSGIFLVQNSLAISSRYSIQSYLLVFLFSVNGWISTKFLIW